MEEEQDDDYDPQGGATQDAYRELLVDRFWQHPLFENAIEREIRELHDADARHQFGSGARARKRKKRGSQWRSKRRRTATPSVRLPADLLAAGEDEADPADSLPPWSSSSNVETDAEEMFEDANAPYDSQNEAKSHKSVNRYYTVMERQHAHSESRKTFASLLRFSLHSFEDSLAPPERLLEKIFRKMIAEMIAEAHRRHPQLIGEPKLLGVQIHGPHFDQPFYVPLRPPCQNTPAALAAVLLWLHAQSGDELKLFEGDLFCRIQGIWPLDMMSAAADGRKKSRIKRRTNRRMGNDRSFSNAHRQRRRRWRTRAGKVRGGCGTVRFRRPIRSLLQLRNTDRLCLARSIIVALVRSKFGANARVYRLIANGRHNFQGILARALLRCANVSTRKRSYGLGDAHSIQHWLDRALPHRHTSTRIIVFSSNCLNSIVFRGHRRPAKHELTLLHKHNHFVPVFRPGELFGCAHYCLQCERAYKPRVNHPAHCKWSCKWCYRSGFGYPCAQEGGGVFCADCRIVYPNHECFEFHREQPPRGGRTLCQNRFRCFRCSNIVHRRAGVHYCPGQPQWRWCRKCAAEHSTKYCFVQPLPHLQAHKSAKQQQSEQQARSRRRYCFFDIETTQEKLIDPRTNRPLMDDVQSDNNNEEEDEGGEQPGCKKHEAVLLICEVICVECLDAGICVEEGGQERSDNCHCGVFGRRFRWRHRCIRGNRRRLCFPAFTLPGQQLRPNRRGRSTEHQTNPVEEFLDFLLHTGPRRVTTVCLSHNGGKFDTHLCLEQAYASGLCPRRMLSAGLKIYSLQFGTVRTVLFKDSLNFFLAPLSALPKTFGLRVEDKPFFPHYAVTRENLDAQLVFPQLPPPAAYGVEFMKEKQREAFLAFYAQNSHREFALCDELLTYCENDVRILRESAIRFRQEMRTISLRVEPFFDSSTIAGLALRVFREEFLTPGTLMNLPETGINQRQRQSYAALRFLRVFQELSGLQIRTAEWSVGEAAVGHDTGQRVDGFLQLANGRRVALEFAGCYFHGCPRCYPERVELYERTKKREAFLKTLGYTVLTMWECRWAEMLKRDVVLKRVHDAQWVPPPMHPRKHALCGGRVEPFVLHHKAGPGEHIEYYDICSLYPYVMKWGMYPVGEPQLVVPQELPPGTLPPFPWTAETFGGTPLSVGNSSTLAFDATVRLPFQGLLFCKVLAPRKMPLQGLPPLLPYKCPKNKQLVFPLCARCADRQSPKRCTHSDAKRCWVQAYTHLELQHALRYGYAILDVFEVESYPDAKQWCSRSTGTGLFDTQIDSFLRVKKEASGWPAGCENEAQRQRYIEKFHAAEGIRLDPGAIHYNAGRRQIAKLLLNSLWGKLCQRANRNEVHITKTPAAFHRLVDDPDLEILDVMHITKELDRVVVRPRSEETQCAPATNNVTIAAYVTSQARLRLYYYMEKLVKNGCVLFYDTDSVVYLRRDGQLGLATAGDDDDDDGIPCEKLGEMVRELPGRKIIEWLSAGAKNYGFLHVAEGSSNNNNGASDSQPAAAAAAAAAEETPKTVLKVRGISLTGALTFQKMRQMVFKYFGSRSIRRRLRRVRSPVLRHFNIGRNRYASVYSITVNKQYRPVLKKRVPLPGRFYTLPFGYTL